MLCGICGAQKFARVVCCPADDGIAFPVYWICRVCDCIEPTEEAGV